MRRTVRTPISIQYQTRDDFDLLRLARHGNTEAYDAFVARHERRVFAVIASITAHAEDAAHAFQAAFAGGYRELASWDMLEMPRLWLLKRAVRAAFARVHARHSDAPSGAIARLRGPLPEAS